MTGDAERIADRMKSLVYGVWLCCANLTCMVILAGCMTSYRYSAQVQGGQSFERGKIEVRDCKVYNNFLRQVTGDREVLRQIQEMSPACDGAERVSLELDTRDWYVENKFFLQNIVTFGLVPGYQERKCLFTVKVIDENRSVKATFDISFVHKERRTFLGLLWPFTGEDYPGEIYATANGFRHKDSQSALESVLGCALLEGLYHQR